jgi:hypothetical protein
VPEDESISMLDLENSLSVRKGSAMKIRELIASLQTMNPERDAFVVLFKVDGTGDVFDLEEISNNDGDAQLEIYEEEPEDEEEDEDDTE